MLLGEAVRDEPELSVSVDAEESDHVAQMFVDFVTSARRLGLAESSRTVVHLRDTWTSS